MPTTERSAPRLQSSSGPGTGRRSSDWLQSSSGPVDTPLRLQSSSGPEAQEGTTPRLQTSSGPGVESTPYGIQLQPSESLLRCGGPADAVHQMDHGKTAYPTRIMTRLLELKGRVCSNSFGKILFFLRRLKWKFWQKTCLCLTHCVSSLYVVSSIIQVT